MKKFPLLAATAALLITTLSVPAANAELTQTERDQFRTDPVGAIAWQAIKGSSEYVRADGNTMMAASFFSMTSPGESIGLPALENCAERVGSSSPAGGVRYVAAALCATFDRNARSQVQRGDFGYAPLG
ncbi:MULTISPECIES: hypothetical protein [Corynebacterium]|uniref:Secreted protein n=1 Tax=Corynebacterium aurimucosum TaxID=169292 RepID=A0A558GLL6_9CORY|nr:MULTISPECIES: hypothetical protein [unclassified Corynebacterium]TVU57794.1 hypothetical protein FQK23_00555 [Corynebacterium aurimucosum]OFL24483.1 hypothetical protein HMPREF2781_02890 [Corynebacterium sp. HMSC062A03]OFP20349.1 hypothetical protein HMPREF2996_06380 [Corynebacterium sp. HMSC066C02]OFQ33612.1 hypothetical protein HMPREF2943_04580 [Corynebacterium sp. HMSC072D12]OFS36354.1 hypothetical protein HMPREF2896_00130 [Corynebacterium sp. HMSC069E04]